MRAMVVGVMPGRPGEPGQPGNLDAVIRSQSANLFVNAALVQIKKGRSQEEVAAPIRRWKRYEVYTRAQMKDPFNSQK